MKSINKKIKKEKIFNDRDYFSYKMIIQKYKDNKQVVINITDEFVNQAVAGSLEFVIKQAINKLNK
jgi:hypothetical protein